MIPVMCNFHRWFLLSRDCIDPLKWPAQPSVASWLTWLERRTGIARSWVGTPLKPWIFQANKQLLKLLFTAMKTNLIVPDTAILDCFLRVSAQRPNLTCEGSAQKGEETALCFQPNATFLSTFSSESDRKIVIGQNISGNLNFKHGYQLEGFWLYLFRTSREKKWKILPIAF